MDTHLVRRGDSHSASPTSKQSSTATTATSPQQTNAHSPSTLNKMASVSIPLDGSGNPLPWSRDSIIQWARSSGFAKFVPAFIQYGIEGYMFYTLKLEDIRQMRIPNVTMQDMIQLNGAIYRLNVAAATPANRSHMSGTLKSPPHRGAAPNSASGNHIYEAQILSRPLQPLRPPRPSWTVRRDDPPATYSHQIQLTSNGMVARPVRTTVRPHPAPLPPRLGPQQTSAASKAGAIVYSQQLTNAKPLDPTLQLQNTARDNPTQPNAPITINTGMEAAAKTSPDADTSSTWAASAVAPGARNMGVSPRSPYSGGAREGQQQQQQTVGERPSRYGTGQSTYRSRNSAHVEVDELPFVRPTQNTWAAGSAPQKLGSPGLPPVRRRSAVIEVFDEAATNASGTVVGAKQIPMPVVSEPLGSSSSLPARYHGTNQPHSPYYAHGASVPTATGTYSYRGVSGGPIARPAGKFHTAQPYPAGRQRRGGTHGLFAESYGPHGGPGSMSGGLSPRHPEQLTGAARGQRRHPPPAPPQPPAPPLRPPPSAPFPLPHMRRTSLSPVLTALQPGNYHIANLPDADLDGSSSSESEPADTQYMSGRKQTALPKQQQQQQHQTSAIPLAINTTLLHDLQASPCDTGESTITPLSVVNVLPGALGTTTNTSPSSQASHSVAGGYEAYVPVEGAVPTSPVIFDAESMAGSDDEDGECRSNNGSVTHFDLVENAVPVEELAAHMSTAATVDESTLLSAVGAFEIWDAEELGGESGDEAHDNVKLICKSPEPETADDTQVQLSASSSASSVFRVMGVRHVSSYSPDFDKTAASLLSSIKTDIAKRVASGEATKRNREFANAASIQAAIEFHQQKKLQQRQQPAAITEDGSESQQRHYTTSRLSGFFGFGQRATPRNGGAALLPLSAPQLQPPHGAGRAPSPKAAASELRVVTDLQTLRNNDSSHPGDTMAGSSSNNNNYSEQITTASSAEGKKSESPSTVTRRWRVPFIQRTMASDNEPNSSNTTGSGGRSRGRAGTTSDIESPLIAVSSTAERPFSMVEGSSSNSNSSSGRSTPRTAAALLQRQQRLADPTSTDSASTRSFVTASPGIDPISESTSPMARADSWTLMFFSKEFVVPQKVEMGEVTPITDALSASPQVVEMDAGREETQTTVVGTEEEAPPPEPLQEEEEEEEDNDDDLLWGGTAPAVVSEDDDDDPKAAAVRADIAEQQSDDGEEEADVQSIASSTRTLPSTMRFTRGMRATLLERKPSRNVRERPTADVIGDQLDKYFPGHDLDRPIVQAVPVDGGDDGMMSSPEFHIILDDDEARSHQSSSASRMAAVNAAQARLVQRQQPRRSVAAVPTTVETLGGGPGRRKSVRMLVQEQRTGRQHNGSRRMQNHLPDAAAMPIASESSSSRFPVLPPEPPSEPWPELVESPRSASSAVVRRKSTKLWGCIPEEIRPRGRRGAVDPSSNENQLPVPPQQQQQQQQQQHLLQPNDEIVRRALSLLRKPESNPQAEKDIVEAAIKCADARTAGSTRAQFVYEQEMKKRRQATSSQGESSSNNSARRSVNDTVRALFVKYGVVAPAGSIRFQWIKGKLIGKGSFGHVHVALNAGTGEVIAVKQIRLPSSLCAAAAAAAATAAAATDQSQTGGSREERGKDQLQEEAIRMMYTEIELLQDMDHENIVQLLGFEVAHGVMSMFLEYVPGGTVQSLVQQHGPLPESVVHSFLRQILAGLGYLHDRGILHRDIKGANILVDETGTCKISDFGISRKADPHRSRLSIDGGSAASAAAAAKRGRILGTVPFMAPEVVRASEYTAGGDIWSLGCVVVQMWSGRGPWDDLQEPQVFFKLGKGLAPPIPDDLTEAGIDFCKNCFGADPASRWAAAELARMDFAQVPAEYEYPYRG